MVGWGDYSVPSHLMKTSSAPKIMTVIHQRVLKDDSTPTPTEQCFCVTNSDTINISHEVKFWFRHWESLAIIMDSHDRALPSLKLFASIPAS